MSNSFWKTYLNQRKLEIRYTTVGAFSGALTCGVGLVADMHIRRLMGLDGSAGATFTSTFMHSYAWVAPVILGRVFYSLGVSRRKIEENLRNAGATERIARDRAARDPVTGLFNRTHLLRELEEGLATGQWAARGAVLLLLDLDDFKAVNDTYGHHAGDAVLMAVAHRIRDMAGPGDIAARLGGDEFVLVHFAAGEDIGRFAQGVLETLSQEVPIDETRVIPRASIGIARVGEDGATCSDVLGAADLALYEAKSVSCGTYSVFEKRLREGRDRRHRRERELRDGLGRGEFALRYQPILGTETGAIRSFEAVAEWRHPMEGVISAVDFMPLAESTGLVIRLGRQMLTEACRTASSWPKPIGIAIDVSPVQFNDPDFVAHVAEVLAETGLAPGRLDIELAEPCLSDLSSHTVAAIHGLKALGVRITLDGFKTGHASLRSIRDLPIDRVKIDESFVREIAPDGAKAEILQAVARLCRSMGVEAVLDGVETEADLALARAEGLPEIQGAYCSPPLIPAAADELIEARRSTRASAASVAA